MRARGGALFGSALVYAVTNALSAGVPFLMLPILTRVLQPEEYGLVAMFGVVVGVLGALTGLNVHGAVAVRYFERDRVDLPRYVATCLAILLASTAVVAALVGLLHPWLESWTQLPARWLLLAVLVSGAQFVVQTQLALWQAARQAPRFAALRLSQAALDASLSLLLVLGAGLAWQGRLGGIAIAACLAAAAALFLLWRSGAAKLPPSRSLARDALAFGVPLVPHTLGGLLIAMVDRVMITNLLDVASTGIYMVALQIGMVLGLFTDAFNKAFAPWLMESLRQDSRERDRRVVRWTYAYFAAVVAAALLLGWIAPGLLGVLVGEKYRAAAPIVVFITLGYAFGGMYLMVTNYVFFAGRTGRLAAVTLASGALNVAASWWLLQRHGLVGAAQAFMLAQATLFLGTWALAQRSRPMPWLGARRAAA
jgi:O-antigen/teichoic acid export membrane protein